MPLSTLKLYSNPTSQNDSPLLRLPEHCQDLIFYTLKRSDDHRDILNYILTAKSIRNRYIEKLNLKMDELFSPTHLPNNWRYNFALKHIDQSRTELVSQFIVSVLTFFPDMTKEKLGETLRLETFKNEQNLSEQYIIEHCLALYIWLNHRSSPYENEEDNITHYFRKIADAYNSEPVISSHPAIFQLPDGLRKEFIDMPLPPSLTHLTEVTILNVSATGIYYNLIVREIETIFDYIPQTIFTNLTKLTDLKLHGSFSYLPREIDHLIHLQKLSILSRNLEKLPEEIGNLSELTSLQLDGCWPLEDLPGTFARLNKNISLTLSFTKISKKLLDQTFVNNHPLIKWFQDIVEIKLGNLESLNHGKVRKY